MRSRLWRKFDLDETFTPSMMFLPRRNFDFDKTAPRRRDKGENETMKDIKERGMKKRGKEIAEQERIMGGRERRREQGHEI